MVYWRERMRWECATCMASHPEIVRNPPPRSFALNLAYDVTGGRDYHPPLLRAGFLFFSWVSVVL